MKNILVVLLGPTGVGKTDISIDLAKRFKCEIISADSRQFYKEMRIGTAVPDDDQLKTIRHHFIQSRTVKEYYSSSLYERDVIELLPQLFSKNKIAILTGGSGMYIDAVCYGIDDIPDVDPGVREKYILKYQEEGIESLRVALKLLDPEHYSKVDLKNYKRIIRSLEICESTGLPYSSFLLKHKRERDFGKILIGLERNREDLYTRINSRVDDMINKGLEEEARQLFEFRNLNALNCVGYREFFDYFDGFISKEEAISLIKRNSRRYAKRQLTWWNKNKEIKWFHPEQIEEIIDYINESIINTNPPSGEQEEIL
jgi:tRNA dimethylallyltransferase